MTTIGRSSTPPPGRVEPRSGRDHAGLALQTEAIRQIQARNWRAASQLVAAARELRPDDLRLHSLHALTTAHHGKSQTTREAIDRLRHQLESTDPTTESAIVSLAWTDLAGAELARRNYRAADAAARQALQADERNVEAWCSLAASYAGLGWFDEMATCMERGESHGTPGSLARWQIGRAINDWGMTRTPALTATVVGVLLLGILGLAVGITTPFFVREVRVGRLGPEPKGLATEAWRSETKIRLVAGAAVALVVIAWAVMIALAGLH